MPFTRTLELKIELTYPEALALQSVMDGQKLSEAGAVRAALLYATLPRPCPGVPEPIGQAVDKKVNQTIANIVRKELRLKLKGTSNAG